MSNIRNIILSLTAVFAMLLNAMPVSAQSNGTRHEARIAVVLPFSSPSAEGPKSLEFYRGMLLAADDMKAQGYDATITAIEEPTPETNINDRLQKLCEKNDVITGFAYRNHMLAAGETARQQECIAAFPMATYIPFDLQSNPACIFTLTSDEKFLDIYAHLLFSCFGKCNIVYVKSAIPQNTGDVLDLLALLRRKGCKSKTIEQREAAERFDGALNTKKPNVVITDTNDANTIQHICRIVADAKRRMPSANVMIAGTQEWMAHLPLLTDVATMTDIYIPTTWYQNNSSLAVDALHQKYAQCFHCVPSSQQPSAMLQGYDFARMTIAGLAHYGKDFVRHKPSAQQLLTVCNFFADCDETSAKRATSCWTNIGIRLLHVKTDGGKELIDLQPGK